MGFDIAALSDEAVWSSTKFDFKLIGDQSPETGILALLGWLSKTRPSLSATKKRMDRNMARGPLYKQFDSERKNARQAEARLSLNLQRLEVICLYHVKTLAREQRQLQKELQRLQQGEARPKGQPPSPPPRLLVLICPDFQE